MADDLVLSGSELLVTMDGDRREIPGGWVAIRDGLVSAVGGPADPVPPASDHIDARGCLVTPGSSTPTTTCTRTSPGPTRRRSTGRCSPG